MLYDIRTQKKARCTLEQITNIPIAVWENEPELCESTGDHILSILDKYHERMIPFEDLDFMFAHLTSSNDKCNLYRQVGLLNLQSAYKTIDSELRCFLVVNGLTIDIDQCLLYWNDERYNISYHSSSPRQIYSGVDELCHRIAYRFYKDYAVCGFLSKGAHAYATNVEEKPEILIDIGDLIGVDIATEWKYTHTPYEITAKVSSNDIKPIGDMLNYAELAFWNAFNEEIDQYILICKDYVQIPPNDIISIQEFSGWF